MDFNAKRLLKKRSTYDLSYLNHICNLDLEIDTPSVKLTSIVCTIGPTSRDPAILEKLIEKGMNIARLNFSHGTHEYHRETIKNIRTAISNYNKKHGLFKPIAIALDTKGPEIRTGVLKGGGAAEIELQKNATIKVTTDPKFYSTGDEQQIYIGHENLLKCLNKGNQIFIDDGQILLKVIAIKPDHILCEIENGGMLGSCKGVHVPGVAISLDPVSSKDVDDLNFGIEEEVDMVFISFTPDANTVHRIRMILSRSKKEIKVISKVENVPGMRRMDEIIAASDGILIDRGDLGMAIPLKKVSLAQKMIIARCNKAAKPVICATQMLESMVSKPRPTRAEITDVSNAVLDGADCVMLCGETAKGDYPVECVEIMSEICKEAEAAIWQKQLFLDLFTEVDTKEVAHTIAVSAVMASIKSIAGAIIIVSNTGKTANLISKYKPNCPIISITKNEILAKQSLIYRGVFPLFIEEQKQTWLDDVNSRVDRGIEYGKKQGMIKSGDTVILVTGWIQDGDANTLRVIDVD